MSKRPLDQHVPAQLVASAAHTASRCSLDTLRQTPLSRTAIAACLLPLVCTHSALADLTDYVNSTSQNPTRTFIATNVSPMPAQVNIGSLPAGRTYEFIVNATTNTAGSLALLGPVMTVGYSGDAIKFDQFPFTGLYGATIFGVQDYSFTVSSRDGAPVVLAFVADPGTQTTRLFVDGVDTGSTVPFAVALSGVVVLGGAWNSSQGYFDVFQGTIIAAATYSSMLSPAEIAAHSQAYYRSCYANCDNSTVVPTLNVNDFVCFQQRYASGDSYANCDASSVAPVLNVADFICFLTRYAAGCS